MSKNFSVSPYVQVQSGLINHAGLDIGAKAGAKFNYKDTYIKPEVGIGTAFTAGIKAGHEFGLNDKMSLDTYAKAQYARSFVGKQEYSVFVEGAHVTVGDKDIDALHDDGPTYHYISEEWAATDKRLGTGVQLNYKAYDSGDGDVVTLGVGLEGAMSRTAAPETVHLRAEKHSGEVEEMDFKLGDKKLSIMPTLSCDMQISFGLSLFADINPSQGQVGLRYKF